VFDTATSVVEHGEAKGSEAKTLWAFRLLAITHWHIGYWLFDNGQWQWIWLFSKREKQMTQ
jgi:hypothetical protein